MCLALRAGEAEVRRLTLARSAVTPELEVVLEKSNHLIGDCQRGMLAHFYAVANEMPPAQARRYLEQMLPVALHPAQSWTALTPGFVRII